MEYGNEGFNFLHFLYKMDMKHCICAFFFKKNMKYQYCDTYVRFFFNISIDFSSYIVNIFVSGFLSDTKRI